MNSILHPTAATPTLATNRGIRRGLAEIALKQAVAEGFDPKWQAGTCPACSGPMVRNFRKVGGGNVDVVEECWRWLGNDAVHTERDDLATFPVEEDK